MLKSVKIIDFKYSLSSPLWIELSISFLYILRNADLTSTVANFLSIWWQVCSTKGINEMKTKSHLDYP